MERTSFVKPFTGRTPRPGHDIMYEHYAINDVLNKLNDDRLVTVKRRQWGGREVSKVTEQPDKEISTRMLNKAITAIKDTQFDASLVDIVKREIGGSPEHFMRMRIGSYIYYLSELGLDVITKMMYDKRSTSKVQLAATEYGMRKTAYRKNRFQTDLYIKLIEEMKLDLDDDDLPSRILSLTEKELKDYCELYCSPGDLDNFNNIW